MDEAGLSRSVAIAYVARLPEEALVNHVCIRIVGAQRDDLACAGNVGEALYPERPRRHQFILAQEILNFPFKGFVAERSMVPGCDLDKRGDGAE
jgi:hypothetical protein